MMENSSKKQCRCPFSANAEKLSLFIGILNFSISALSILGTAVAMKYNMSIITPMFSPKDQLFTPEFLEVTGQRVVIFGSVLTLVFSAMMVLGIRRRKSCGAKAFFFYGVLTLSTCAVFSAYCVLSAFVDQDFLRIVPQIIFFFLYIFYGLELAVVHRAFVNMDEMNAYQLISSRAKLIPN